MIDRPQPVREHSDPDRGQLLVQASPVLRTWSCAKGIPVQQGCQVEAAATHDQREPASSLDLGMQAPGLGGPRRDAEWLPRLHQVDEVVRESGPCRRIGLGGTDIHAAVDLARVRHQDLDRVAPRQRQRQLCLA